MVVNTQVPFDINYAQQFAVGTKVCVGAVFDKKTLQHQWSGEACVKSVLLPLRYLKAAQADANSSYSLTQSHILLERLTLAPEEVQPSKAAQAKFLKGVLVSKKGKCLNDTPRSLKELFDNNNLDGDVYADIKSIITKDKAALGVATATVNSMFIKGKTASVVQKAKPKVLHIYIFMPVCSIPLSAVGSILSDQICGETKQGKI